LIERSAQLEPRIKRLEAVRVRLEREMALIDGRDPDIIEELAAEVLGFVRAGDRVLLAPAEALAPAPGAPRAGR